MLAAVIPGVALIVACFLLHYEILQSLDKHLPHLTWLPRRMRVLVALFGVLASHLAQISLFAMVYYLLRDRFGLGQFGGQFEDTFTSFLYFSTETYTTLGLGDIYPMGTLRLELGLETLTGLLMISWSASFSYLEMRRYW